MSSYKLVYEGLTADCCETHTSQQLKQAFKLSSEQVTRLLQNPGTIIKRNISKPKARELKLALAKFSVQSSIIATPNDAASPKSSLADQASRRQLALQPLAEEARKSIGLQQTLALETQDTCPKCQQPLSPSQQQRDSCPACGIVFAKFKALALPSVIEGGNDKPLTAKRYGIAATVNKHSRTEPAAPPFKLSGILVIALVGLLLLGLQYIGDYRQQQRLSLPGIQVMSVDSVDKLQQLLVPGHITIIDFYSEKCGICKRRSHNLELLAAKNADLVIRRFNVTDGKAFQQAAKTYGLNDPVRHARIYDAEGKLQFIDKGDDQYYATQFIRRWSLRDERPAFKS